jgi:hypothetical protein
MSQNKNHDEEFIPEFAFDKFMDDIVSREDSHKEKMREYVEGHRDSPQREYNRLYREKPQNRVIWRKKK